jgi:hypothetical protein
MISSSLLLTLFVKLVIAGLIFYVLFWALGKIGLPEPFSKIALVVLVLIIVIYLLDLLLGLSGVPLIR